MTFQELSEEATRLYREIDRETDKVRKLELAKQHLDVMKRYHEERKNG